MPATPAQLERSAWARAARFGLSARVGGGSHTRRERLVWSARGGSTLGVAWVPGTRTGRALTLYTPTPAPWPGWTPPGWGDQWWRRLRGCRPLPR